MIIISVDFNSNKKTLAMVETMLIADSNCCFVIVDNSPTSSLVTESFKSSMTELGLDVCLLNANEESLKPAALNNKLIVLSGHGNIGFGGGMNLATDFVNANFPVDILSNEIICLINPDVNVLSVNEGAIARLIEKNGRKALVGPSYRSRLGLIDSPYHYYGVVSGLIYMRPWRLRRQYLCGGCIFFHQSQIAHIKFDDKRYFLYWEEVDLQMDLMSSGWVLNHCKEVEISHEVGGTMPSREFALENFGKSRYLFFVKHHNWASVLCIVLTTILTALKFVLTGKAGCGKALLVGLSNGIISEANS